VIRLGVMWPGVEPIQGWYNMTYIKEIHKIVDVCREHNIFVVLEYHQDGFSEKFCGEGVPHWAAKNHGFANIYGKFPWPMDGYTTEWKMGTNEN
jgi:endoglycosylceramidase